MQEYFLTLFIIVLFNYLLKLPKSLKFGCMVLVFTAANVYQIFSFHKNRSLNYFEVMGLQEVDSVSKELVEKQFQKKMEQNLQPDEQKLLY